MECGIHGYVVNGYGAHRLRAVVHVARARFERERRIRAELADVTRRFDERKLVDRAKGILMRARQVSEEEAFAVLRAASMHSNRRVGQVSQQVIAAAHYADAVNRAGKLRMLSQRFVKAGALGVLDRGVAGHGEQLDDTARQIDANIGALARSLSKPTFGDLLDAVAAAWAAVQEHRRARARRRPARRARRRRRAAAAARRAADAPARDRRPGDDAARHQRRRTPADALAAPRQAGAARPAARGRRSAGRARRPGRTAATFEQALAHLRSIPLSTAEIRALLDRAERAWNEVAGAARRLGSRARARALDASSETLLAVFEELTDRYERSMQVLMG